jgi:dTDP-4-dehydrorhamnose reductase
MSTDALLDGEHAPYDEAAAPSPVHEYGQWKARAELHVRATMPGAAVIRTSLIVRLDPLDAGSAWVAVALGRGERPKLFTDELRCPIIVEDLARQVWEITALPVARQAGVWNLAGPEALSRYTLGLLVAAHQRLDPDRLIPTPSAALHLPRPRDLRLTTARADRELTVRARSVSTLLVERAHG